MKSILITVFVAVLLIIMIFSNSNDLNYESDHLNYEYMYSWASEAGFSEKFLDDIDEETLKMVYAENIDAEELIIVEKVNELDISSPGNINTNHMTYIITTSTLFHAESINKVNVYVTAKWLDGRPRIRLTDHMIINWDSNVWIYQDDSFHGKIISVSNTNDLFKTNYVLNRPGELYQGELGWHVPLSKTALGFTPTIRASFSLTPIDTNMSWDNLFIKSIYTHKMVGFSTNTSVSILSK